MCKQRALSPESLMRSQVLHFFIAVLKSFFLSHICVLTWCISAYSRALSAVHGKKHQKIFLTFHLEASLWTL